MQQSEPVTDPSNEPVYPYGRTSEQGYGSNVIYYVLFGLLTIGSVYAIQQSLNRSKPVQDGKK
jgi:hypothetical protein